MIRAPHGHALGWCLLLHVQPHFRAGVTLTRWIKISVQGKVLWLFSITPLISDPGPLFVILSKSQCQAPMPLLCLHLPHPCAYSQALCRLVGSEVGGEVGSVAKAPTAPRGSYPKSRRNPHGFSQNQYTYVHII